MFWLGLEFNFLHGALDTTWRTFSFILKDLKCQWMNFQLEVAFLERIEVVSIHRVRFNVISGFKYGLSSPLMTLTLHCL